MPGLLAIMIWIIFSGYYFHDKCVIERAAYSAVLKAASGHIYGCDDVNVGCSENEISGCVEDYFSGELDKRLLGDWDIVKSVTIDSDTVIINVKGQMSYPDALMSFLEIKFFSVDITESAMHYYEPEYIIRG